MRDYKINNDLMQTEFKTLNFAQYDNGCKITINLFDNGKVVDLSSCKVIAKFKLSNNKEYSRNCINININSFDVVLDSTLTSIVGILKINFKIIYDDETKQVNTFVINANIKEVIGEGNGGNIGGNTGNPNVNIDLSDYYTKEQVDEKLDLLPVKTTNYLMKDAIPDSDINNLGDTVYYFNDVVYSNLDVEVINCNVTYIQDNKEITKDIELMFDGYNYCIFDELNNFGIVFSPVFIKKDGEIVEKCNIAVYTDLVNYTHAEVKKATLSCEIYSNLLKNEHIENINYSKIINLPYELQNIVGGDSQVLTLTEKLKLKKNLLNLNSTDINLYNQAPYTTDAPNNVFRFPPDGAKGGFKINTKEPSLGKGIKIENFSYINTYYFYYTRSDDVLIKIVDGKGKIIEVLNNNEFEKGDLKVSSLQAYTIEKGVDAYIIFSVKEGSTETFNVVGFMYMITMGSEILTYDDLDSKVDKSQLSFNQAGELVVTINGVSKTFVPKS